MGFAGQNEPGRSAAEGLPAKIRASLELLAEAYDYARDTECDVWEYAVEIDTLQDLKLTPNDFRWLVRKGYVEHRQETTRSGANCRRFRCCRGRTFYKRSCFILTGTGLGLVRGVTSVFDPPAQCDDYPATRDDPGDGSPPPPHWSTELHELRVNGQLIKCFRSPAPNQEVVLAAFEEEGWPRRIDDPLPQRSEPGQAPKRRLSDTIKSLNHCQTVHRVQFSGDGTGEGVRWEWVDGNSSDKTE